MAATMPPAQEPERESNSIARIFGALFSPAETFRSIVRKPTWLLPVILIVLLSLAVVGIFAKRGGWESYFQRQDQVSSRFQQLTPQQQRQAIQAQMKFGPVAGYASAAVAPFIDAVVLAAIFLGVFNLIGGAQVKFKTSLGIVSYALTPLIISGLLGIVILYLKDPATVDLQNIVASNAGVFLSRDAPRWQVSLLSSLDVFSFWAMSLLAIGYSAAEPKKFSFAKAFAYIFAIWLVFVLVKVGATAAAATLS
jgi:hypothetical protein